MRLVIATTMWKRPEVFRFWAQQVNKLKEQANFEIIPLAVGSEGRRSKGLCDEYGINYYEFPNMPLGRKANARLKFCERYNPDWILFLGSDNVISFDLLEEYQKHFDNYDVIECKDIYYFDTRTKQSVYCEGYDNHRKGEPLAVGRCISRYVAEQNNWSLWNDRSFKGIDSAINKKLSPFRRKLIEIKDKHLVLDIKGNQNISTFDTRRSNWHLINDDFFKEKTDFEKLKTL